MKLGVEPGNYEDTVIVAGLQVEDSNLEKMLWQQTFAHLVWGSLVFDDGSGESVWLESHLWNTALSTSHKSHWSSVKDSISCLPSYHTAQRQESRCCFVQYVKCMSVLGLHRFLLFCSVLSSSCRDRWIAALEAYFCAIILEKVRGNKCGECKREQNTETWGTGAETLGRVESVMC